jgi:hypothetical protein
MIAMPRAVTLAAAVLLSACATGRSAAPTSAAAGQGQAGAAKAAAPKDAVAKTTVICQTERPIGSNIAKRVCYREEDLERIRARTQDDLVRMMQQSSAQPKRE